MFWTRNISSITHFKCTPNQFGTIFLSKRWKKTETHWAKLRNKKTATEKALEHFDDFYSSVYGKKWRSIRLALLSPQKYCAVINHFGNSDATTTLLENEGAHNMRQVIETHRNQLKERKKEMKKEKELDKIFDLEKELENREQQMKQEELQNLYPKHVDAPEQTSDKPITEKDDGIDWTRQIDPKRGLSAAALYDYVPTTKLKGMEDWVLESQQYSYYEKYLQVPIEIVDEDKLQFPEHLNVYSFETCNMSYFPEPKRGPAGVLNYYLMNASSLLPVLALNLAPGDQMLDMCASPGGKTIVALQTLYPERLVSNDLSRSLRLKRVLQDYFYDAEKRVQVTYKDGRHIDEIDVFNKILVDVPCTNDRHSVIENDNNIFKSTRLKDRFRLPEMQAELLHNALKLVTIGGTVVYSTCSLSPIQNDGVVQMALRRIWEETNNKFVIRNMTKALQPAEIFYKFEDSYKLKYGQVVVPYMPANFGPLYFCKLVRVA